MVADLSLPFSSAVKAWVGKVCHRSNKRCLLLLSIPFSIMITCGPVIYFKSEMTVQSADDLPIKGKYFVD
jgi:hypothetical protein